jgi:hypothetical protein
MAKAARGGGAFDDLLMLRKSTDGSLSTTGTYNGVAINETPAGGMTARVVVPAAAGTGPQLIMFVQTSDDDVDANYKDIAVSEPITAAGEYAIRFATQRKYARCRAEVAGTTPDFGAVQVGIVPAGF